MKSIKLKLGKEVSAKRFHPWIFTGAIAQISPGIQDGDWVMVKDSDGALIGLGHYQGGASIAVRLLSFKDLTPKEIYESAIKSAFDLRQKMIIGDTNCYRLIHGEGDLLPGLIVDIYDGHAVIQAHSVGIFRDFDYIVSALITYSPKPLKAIYSKSGNTLHQKIGQEKDGFLLGDHSSCVVKENGLKFKVNWVEGQKTGFYLDQRDNRRLLGQFAANRSVLNTFCYSGGFSIYALAHGATKVVSVDESAKALDLVAENTALNELNMEHHEIIKADVLTWIKSVEDKSFDIAVVDPPAFAKSHAAKHRAAKAYTRLNAATMAKVKSGGFLFTFSCSQAISVELFRSIIFSAGLESGRKVRILDTLTQAKDHPINLFHPEGEYLKGLMLEISD